jgi:hypothetical protein
LSSGGERQPDDDQEMPDAGADGERQS